MSSFQAGAGLRVQVGGMVSSFGVHMFQDCEWGGEDSI